MLAAVKRVKSAVRGRKEPIPWKEFVEWVLDGSKDEMWEKCWKGYQAGLIEDSYRAQYNEEFWVVWETDATAKDRKNPKVVIRPDSKMDRFVPSEQAAAEAMGLYRFYESNKDRFRQALERARDRTRNESAKTRRTAQLPETFVEQRRGQ